MALLQIETLAEDVQLGMWKIEESEAYFIRTYPWLTHVVDGFSHVRSQQRRLEILAVYALLYELTHNKELIITHDDYGCPHVTGSYIGISHTKGFAILIFSHHRMVAADIEYRSDRVGKISHKFIRTDEVAPTIEHQLINWSAKETMYKYFSTSGLQSSDIRIVIPEIRSSGILIAENLQIHRQATVFYRLNNDYVLTFLY